VKKQNLKKSISKSATDKTTPAQQNIVAPAEASFTAKMQYDRLEHAVKAWSRDDQGFLSEEKTFLTLGGAPPTIPGANLHGSVGSPCAGIILFGKVEALELVSALDQAPDPSLPIADFGNNDLLRRDFVGSRLDQANFQEMEQRFAPIWRRLSEFPFSAARESRTEMAILRLAYSRDTAIKAMFDPNLRRLVKYPLLGTAAGETQSLEILADVDLLRRRHFTRTHACTKCDSARLHVYEACPSCGGADLQEEPLIHHYRCGCQEVESHFKQDQLLVCPKCHRTLRHFGVDYGKPGTAVICASCGAVNSEPLVNFICLDCSTVTAANDAQIMDWYHYDLTEEGILALRQGQLPQFELAPLLEKRTHAYSPREFQLLATQELKVAKRFDLAFSVARITVLNIDALVRQLGAVAAVVDFRRVVDAVVVELRTTDFVGISTMQSMVIGFPGTSAKDVEVALARVRLTIEKTVSARLETSIEVAEGDAIVELLTGS
jgi:Thaumarchaeal output domain 1